MKRDFDVVLYGATGFTGRQTAEYFKQHVPPGLRWAIAGRNRQKLEALEAGVPVLVADSTDQAQCEQLVARARVLLSTAGPFALYSDGIVYACVNTGTHYVSGLFTMQALRALRAAHRLSSVPSVLTDQFYGASNGRPAAFNYCSHRLFASGEAMARVQEAYWFYQSQGGNHARGHVLSYSDLPRTEHHQEIVGWAKAAGISSSHIRSAAG